jgi:mRNA-degrading endonuclease RelE of RelBE toxin-antitoxin system
MDLRIADTFTDSLAKLAGDEQKLVKTTAFDLQMNPAKPGMSFHKLEKAKDKNFWSIRVGSDIRLIVHRTEASLLLCFVGHHDHAYQWAERRKLTIHPKTGAAQLVEVRERVEEITIPRYVEAEQAAPSKPLIFAETPEEDLLGYGVPAEWLDEVRKADEDSLLELADHLPREAAEALLELATGVTPQIAQPVPVGTDPFKHPDALRRFRVMNNVEELERAMEYPWEKWTVFLHPAQRESVERDYGGPARVSGSAGTGKTIVALHRAVFLAKANPNSRVILTTFSETLANTLRIKLRRLIGNEPKIGERLEVSALNAFARRLYERNLGRPKIASRTVIRQLLKDVAGEVPGNKFSLHFLTTEWEEVVDAWQLDTWEAYRDVARLGRKTRLPEKQREVLWAMFERVRATLKAQGLVTLSNLFNQLTSHLAKAKQRPFDYIVVDEAQDVSVSQLRFLATLGAGRPNSLFFAGDLGQRIFQQPFSWKALGVDIRGRSRTLRINYRTSHQIRAMADRLLGPEVTDVDGNTEERRGTVSVFNGPEPTVKILDTPKAESETVGRWLAERIAEDVKPHEMGVFVRSPAEMERAQAAVKAAGLPFKVLDDNVETTSGCVSISTMHLAKGLEFRAVVVMACDDEILPLKERIESVADDTDLEEVFNTERHLFYVACTRARDCLLVTSVAPASEFLDDLKM